MASTGKKNGQGLPGTVNSARVIALIYKLISNGMVDYSKAPPLCIDEKWFSAKVEGNEVRFDLKECFLSEDLARERIEEYVERWEIDEGLRRNSDCFNLEFEYSIDDSPGIKAGPARFSVTVSEATGTVRAPKFPPAPAGFKLEPYVALMYHRYMRFRDNRDTLPSMAYFCLTVLEETFGSRRDAADRLFVSRNLLDEIARLSSKKGGPGEARKAEGAPTDLSGPERSFLEESIRQIIRRCAEVLGKPNHIFRKITRSDFS